MTGTDLCVNKPHKSRSYLNHLVFPRQFWDLIFIFKGNFKFLFEYKCGNYCIYL